jgi:anaerobic selenocysteine-containing dehydrogenase
MAEKSSAIKQESGPEYFAMMQGTGRPYTDFTSRFINAFGSPNFTGIAHICYMPRVFASVFSMGTMQPPVGDVYGFGGQKPACIVIWGSNITRNGGAQGTCGGMVKRALKTAQKVIVIDPRRIGPAKDADLWLQIRPGTDGALALAMINVIIAEGLIDRSFVDNYTQGFEELAQHVRQYTPDWAQTITRVSAADIQAAARMYATTPPASIQWGNAIDMSACSFHTARSLMILRAITGNIDRPGGDVIWVTPEDVRMKSLFVNSEMTGKLFLPLERHRLALDGKKSSEQVKLLDRTLVKMAYRAINSIVRRFYPQIVKLTSKRAPGQQIKMLGDLKAAKYPLCPIVHPPTFWRSIISGEPYRIRAMWIMGSNPLVNMTSSLEVEKALRLLEYLVVSDHFLTPTAQLADLVLPASMWLEQDDVVNYAKQWCVVARKKVAQVGQTRDDREVMIQLAKRLGLEDAFPWQDYRDFIDWMLQDTGLSFREFCEKGILVGQMRYYKYRTDGFATPSKKFELRSSLLEDMGVSPLPVYREPPLTPLSAPDVAIEYPLILTTGAKIRNFFHSEGRQIPLLRRGNPDPLVEIHPETAAALGISDRDWVWIETKEGRVRMRAKLFDGIAPDVVSAQHAWWFPEDEPPEYGWKKSSVNLVFGEMEYDPDNGAESLRSALCRIYSDTTAFGGS